MPTTPEISKALFSMQDTIVEASKTNEKNRLLSSILSSIKNSWKITTIAVYIAILSVLILSSPAFIKKKNPRTGISTLDYKKTFIYSLGFSGAVYSLLGYLYYKYG